MLSFQLVLTNPDHFPKSHIQWLMNIGTYQSHDHCPKRHIQWLMYTYQSPDHCPKSHIVDVLWK